MTSVVERENEKLVAELTRLAPTDGLHPTTIPNVAVMRSGARTLPLQTMYAPGVCIVVQGRIKVTSPVSEFTALPLQFLKVMMPLPLELSIAEASKDEPMLGLVLTFDQTMLTRLVVDVGDDDNLPPPPPNAKSVDAHDVTDSVLRAAQRLLDVLKDPLETRLFGDSAVKQVYYHLLYSSARSCLLHYAVGTPVTNQIMRTVRHMEENYHQHMDVAFLAQRAGMSESAYYSAYKLYTGNSPMQYLKLVRLHNARVLLLSDDISMSDAAYRVGYTSHSQFTREFKRLFGKPPSQAAETLPKHSIYGAMSSSGSTT